MSDFAIRTARPTDFAAIGEVTVTAYEDAGYLEGDGDYAAELADVSTRAREATVLVAVDPAGVVLGSVTFCRPGSAYAELAAPSEAEFRMLAVANEARGRGIGEALVQACVNLARHHGDTAVVLSSQASMRSAHRIYERLGFTRAPERDHEPVPGVVLNAYRLVLGPADRTTSPS